MEEVRLEFFREAGFNWREIEEVYGIMIPVLYQSVVYKKAIKFDDEVIVSCKCDKFNGVKMAFSYQFRLNGIDVVCAEGITKHGFIDSNYKPVILKDKYKEGYYALLKYINGQEHYEKAT